MKARCLQDDHPFLLTEQGPAVTGEDAIDRPSKRSRTDKSGRSAFQERFFLPIGIGILANIERPLHCIDFAGSVRHLLACVNLKVQ